MPPKVPERDTAQHILDSAAHLVQTRGYNGFSYADIAAELGVTKASLHYHFATKAELGRALIARYEQAFAAALAGIDQASAGEHDKLRRYARIYADVLRDGKLCLCGMLAAEYATLPEPMQRGLTQFFDLNEQWLAGVLGRGRRGQQLAFEGTALDAARAVMASLEGAMMLARSYGDASRFEATVGRLLSALALPAAKALRPKPVLVPTRERAKKRA